MMGLAERFSAISLRDGFTVVGEIVAFSALGASLAWMMWAVVEPVEPIASSATAKAPDGFEQIAGRLSGIPEVSLGTPHQTSHALQDAGGFALFSARAGANGGGTAIISVNGAAQAAFAVGEEIVPGARLVSVANDHVAIESAGRTLIVSFAGASAPQPPSLLKATAPQQPGTDAANSLVNSLSLRPVNRADGQSGFEVTSEASLSVLGVSGLRAGDILLKINGVDVSSANLAAQAPQLQAGRALDIVYERNGQISTTRIGTAAP